VIDGMLGELADRLDAVGVRGKWRRRVLDEACDHLQELAAEDAETAAARFGDPGEVARLVAAELANARTRSAAYATFAALALAGVAFTSLLALVPAAGGWPDIASGRVAAAGPALGIGLLVLPQIAFVSGCLALVRALGVRRVTATAAELGLLRRRSAVALAAGGASLAVLAADAVNSGAALAAWWAWTTVIACAVLSAPLAAAATRVAASARPMASPGGRAGDVFDDFTSLFALASIRRLALPEHPWRFAALAAAAMGVAATAVGWHAEGDPVAGIVRGAFEAGAVLICFALLGRLLGLRQSKR
jgi:hypothetical protein